MTSARVPARRRASAAIASAATPVIGGGPGGVLRLAVGLAEQIALEHRPADGVAVEEGAVVQPFADQRVHDRQHQRGVGAGRDGMNSW